MNKLRLARYFRNIRDHHVAPAAELCPQKAEPEASRVPPRGSPDEDHPNYFELFRMFIRKNEPAANQHATGDSNFDIRLEQGTLKEQTQFSQSNELKPENLVAEDCTQDLGTETPSPVDIAPAEAGKNDCSKIANGNPNTVGSGDEEKPANLYADVFFVEEDETDASIDPAITEPPKHVAKPCREINVKPAKRGDRKLSAKEEANDAIWKLIEPCLPGLIRVAYRYAWKDRHLLPDLIQVGFLGTLKAAKKFDESRGVSFQAYARIFYRNTMKRYYLRWYGYRESPKALATEVEISYESIMESDTQDGAEEANTDKKSISPAVSSNLNDYRDDSGDAEGRTRPDEAEIAARKVERDDLLNTTLGQLDNDQQTLLETHFGSSDGEPMTYEQIAASTGESENCIKKRVGRWLRKLHETLKRHNYSDYDLGL